MTGRDFGYRHSLLEAIHLHLTAKFGPAGRRPASSARFLDNPDSLRDFARKCWSMFSLKKIRECLDQAYECEMDNTRKST